MPINEKLILEIKADVANLKKGIAQSKQSVSGFQSTLKGAAGTLKVAFVAALALAARAAIKGGMDFDRSMTKIKALVGVAGDEVDSMGKRTKQMANDIGVSSTEAADALFFITSAGLRGSEAMDVLEASMKASAIGLGETKVVADLATSALNAYAGTGMSAVDATDVLTAAVREGKLEASELAGSMGSVLPIASAMGVKFHEVGAAFAAMSRTGTNASEAATQIRSILVAINKPSATASKRLDDMGISADFLRQKIKDDGLLSVLELLKEKFEGNVDAQNEVFSGQRAMMGVMDLLGSNAEATGKTFDALTRSTGALGTAYDIVAESDSRKLDKALTQLSNQLTALGTIVLPPLVDMIEITGAAFSTFAKVASQLTMFKGYALAIEAQEEALRQLEIQQNKVSQSTKNLFNETTLFGDSLITLKKPTQDWSNELLLQAKLLNDAAAEVYKEKLKEIKRVTEETTQATEKYNTALTNLKNQETVLGKAFDFTSAKIDLINNTMIELLNNGLGTTQMFKDLKTELLAIAGVKTGTEVDVSWKTKDEVFPELKPILFKPEEWNPDWDEVLRLRKEGMAKVQEEDSKLLEEDLAKREEAFGLYAIQLQAIGQVFAEGLGIMTDSLVDSFGLADTGIQGFVKSMLKMLARFAAQQLIQLVITKLLSKIDIGVKQGVANASAITAATNMAAGMGPFGLLALPNLILAATGMVNTAFAGVQAFAEGGIVTSPTMGLVGEAGNEAIIPLDRLGSIMGKQEGEFVLRGSDLILAMERAEGFQSRITG
tara:strand:+ start:960 stop:3293 length:2334 start_codon:yes stop_codon:yes gene_type:complete